MGTLSLHEPVPGLLTIDAFNSAVEIASSRRLATPAADQALVLAGSAWLDWRWCDTSTTWWCRALGATDLGAIYDGTERVGNLAWSNHYRLELRDYWHVGGLFPSMGRRQIHTNPVMLSLGPTVDLAHAVAFEGPVAAEVHAGAVGSLQVGVVVLTGTWEPLVLGGTGGLGPPEAGIFGVSAEIDPRDPYRALAGGPPGWFVLTLVNPEIHYAQYPLPGEQGLVVRELTWRIIDAVIRL